MSNAALNSTSIRPTNAGIPAVLRELFAAMPVVIVFKALRAARKSS